MNIAGIGCKVIFIYKCDSKIPTTSNQLNNILASYSLKWHSEKRDFHLIASFFKQNV